MPMVNIGVLSNLTSDICLFIMVILPYIFKFIIVVALFVVQLVRTAVLFVSVKHDSLLLKLVAPCVSDFAKVRLKSPKLLVCVKYVGYDCWSSLNLIIAWTCLVAVIFAVLSAKIPSHGISWPIVSVIAIKSCTDLDVFPVNKGPTCRSTVVFVLLFCLMFVFASDMFIHAYAKECFSLCNVEFTVSMQMCVVVSVLHSYLGFIVCLIEAQGCCIISVSMIGNLQCSTPNCNIFVQSSYFHSLPFTDGLSVLYNTEKLP